MMKALFATALLALVGVTALAPTTAAQVPGVCIGICVEVTKVDSDVYNNIQTCAGNVAVQIGVGGVESGQ